jgi:hypothetical protein
VIVQQLNKHFFGLLGIVYPHVVFPFHLELPQVLQPPGKPGAAQTSRMRKLWVACFGLLMEGCSLLFSSSQAQTAIDQGGRAGVLNIVSWCLCLS